MTTATMRTEAINCFCQKNLGLEMDREDEERLIEDNLGIVKALAHKYSKAGYRGCDFEELEAVGNLRLVKCAQSFEISGETKFASYAYKSIEGEIINYIHKNMTLLTVPVRDMREMNKKLVEQKHQGLEAVALDGLSVLSTDSDDYQDEAKMEPGFDKALDTDFMDWLLCELQLVLTPREYRILYSLYGLGGEEPVSMRELAKEYGISPARVSKIAKNIIKKIQDSEYIMSVLVESTEIGARSGYKVKSGDNLNDLRKKEADGRLLDSVRSNWEGCSND